ncbi:hypothetical protein [Brachybacterium squillarum]|nr:hypothetical protein [Brachybacterium squillarum]
MDPVRSVTEAELTALLEDPEIQAAHRRAREHPEGFTPADDLP